MTDCDHSSIEDAFDRRELETIELVRCPRCDTLLNPMLNDYSGDVFYAVVPLSRKQFANVIDLFLGRKSDGVEEAEEACR